MVTVVSSSMYGASLQPRGRRRPVGITRPNASDHFTTPITSTVKFSPFMPKSLCYTEITPATKLYMILILIAFFTQPPFKEFQQQLTTKLKEASAAVTIASSQLLDKFVDSTFTFSQQSLRPTEKNGCIASSNNIYGGATHLQSNFAPVDEIGERTEIVSIEGTIPDEFPEGVYIRNGSNPLFGALHTVNSIFGQSEDIWVEGEGMLHATYFTKNIEDNTWSVSYNNRYVQSDTFRMERDRQRPRFLSVTKGNPLAMLAASILNMVRFGKVIRNISNTSVFQHAGRVFSAAENDIPHEIDLENLGTLRSWCIDGEWNMPFTAHPKVAPRSGELVIYGFNFVKPFMTVGLVSEDGKKLKRKVDLKLERCALCHEIGITKILLDYETESYARIGVIPRYGDADSVIWFDVEPFCTLHLVNGFEEDDEADYPIKSSYCILFLVLQCSHVVVMRGFRVPASIIMGPTLEHITDEKPDKLNEEYFSRLYEWRLNLKSRGCTGNYLTGTDVALEFPVINDRYVGLHHNATKFGGFAKLYLEDKNKAHIIDARRFDNGPIAKITLPHRVPYGFHGAFILRNKNT
uniref:Carotenoid cleavage dioxygenase n=1 Tax=Leersia perrieri TaxID=77586 RepID=A0A0D9X792_9ORYZ